MAPKIFISYRRDDSAYATDSIYVVLSGLFGKENVFLDVGSIPLGVDFRSYLRDQIAAHDVVLVIIGPEWGRMMRERAAQHNDFVRVEIESALTQNKLVIPILVMNATMPDFAVLPPTIQDLQWRNSAIVRRQPDLEQDCRRLADGIMAYLTKAQAISRNAASSSPPAGKGSIDLLPQPFAWIEIPGERGTMNTEKVMLTIPSEHYWITKYPVTNAQYAKFIEADGYSTQRWWTVAGWKQREKDRWTEPRKWRDSQWNSAEQPVVGVSWYEAVAFCLWVSDVTGEKIMLPTEAQWQYAAQGSDGRAYPWGKAWDGNCCNNNVGKKGLGRTTSTRQYEGKGDSPFGVVDMAGNVREWCLTDFKNQTNDLNTDAEQRVLRGGSWYLLNTGLFRCDYRDRDLPDIRYDDLGFRLSLS